MDKYQVIKKLGEGAYGVVIKAVNTQTQDLVAIKKLKGKNATPQYAMSMPEVQSLKKLNGSPFIVKIIELIHQGGNTSPRGASAENQGEVSIVFEYCERNLY